MTLTQALSDITKDNGAVRDLRELIVLEKYNDPELSKFFTAKLNVENGKHLGFLGEMQNIGWKGAECDPTYVSPKQNFAEKVWNIGEWSAPLKWCYKDFLDTIAEYALNKGTDIADITTTDVMNVLIKPALEDALLKAYWRMIWFGDTAAKNVTSGGVIKDGTDVTLFTTTDGLFKQLFAVGSASADQVTTIAANSQTTYATQKSALLTSGTAMGIVDNVLYDADSRIASQAGAALFMTKSVADALTRDLKNNYKWILSWEQITNGVAVTEYNGTTIYSVAIWDRLINEFENDGTKWNLPHRIIYGTPEQMFVGTPANQVISDLEINFDPIKRNTHAYVAGRIGTLVGQDDLFQLAY